MNTKLRIADGLLMAILFSGLGACTTQEATGGGGTGGGGVLAGTGGATTPGGNGGATAGTTGSSGTDGEMCPLPASPLITDFTYVPALDGSATTTTEVRWGSYGATLSGGEYTYPAAIVSDVTQSNWHMSGTVGTYSGFGLYWDNCSRVDASAYKGISFKISGSVPQGDHITMGIGTLNNVITADWLLAHPTSDSDTKAGDPGRCVPPATATNKYSQSTCHDLEAIIPVTAAVSEVKVLWSGFTKGAPDTSVEPKDILTVYWFFPWAETATPYLVDITIDDLSFIE